MNGEQTVHAFWASFGWDAYDETSVPAQKPMPYITHEGAVDTFGHEVAQVATLWYRSSGWTEITAKRREIEARLTKGGLIIPYDGGAVLIRRGDPWAQRRADAVDDMARSIVLNYTVEFIE